MTEKSQKPFGDDFLWGASTASHQVEGDTYNQWSVWELSHASERAKDARHRLDWTPTWKDIEAEAKNPANYVSDMGVEHYTRYKEDFDLVKKLNLNAFRFGIEWSRIEPEEGQWDEGAIEHYRQYIQELRKRGIEPFVNLWHWTNPVWFEDMGGFAKKKNIPYFERFVAKVADALLDDITYVLTINEANNFAVYGYMVGTWPPGQKNPLKTLAVYRNLVTAHKRAYHILKVENPQLQIGVAHNASVSKPVNRKNPIDQAASYISEHFWQWWFFDKIRHDQDFVGMNFYFVNHFNWGRLANPKEPLNDMGWYMEPGAVYDLIMRAHKFYKKPIFITENGVADRHDQHRKWWLAETMKAMAKARQSGADLQGYFHWSLLDNFEWAEGWWPKFGLVEVDRKTMKRTIRPSAKAWAATLKKLK
jgi:beta-glucosidase